LEGKEIATSYPNTLSNYLKEKNITANIHEISGSVEIAPLIGLADAICDLVSSGSTLAKNGLVEKEILLKSTAWVFSNKNLNEKKQQLLDQLIFRIQSVLTAKENKYVLLNAPTENLEEIIALLPGMKSPTVLPLAIPGWNSVHTVINENDFWNIIDLLKQKGAQGILIVPIEKMII
jgi:ATP phosphoribosyltransferase